MKQGLTNFIFFVAGAAIGSLVTKKLIEDKYNKLIDEQVEKEVQSVKDVFERDKEKFEEMNNNIKNDIYKKEERVLQDYSNQIKDYGYSYKDYVPQIVPYADYLNGDYDQYELEELTYYADGVLATTNGDEMITEQEAMNLIGLDIFYNLRDYFGNHEDSIDTICVKNDETMMIYEIFRDSRTYLEITEE